MLNGSSINFASVARGRPRCQETISVPCEERVVSQRLIKKVLRLSAYLVCRVGVNEPSPMGKKSGRVPQLAMGWLQLCITPFVNMSYALMTAAG